MDGYRLVMDSYRQRHTSDSRRQYFLVALVVSCLAAAAHGDSGKPWVQLNWENDIFANEDAGYTNGVGVTWGYTQLAGFDDDSLPGWLSAVVAHTHLAALPRPRKAVSYAVGQMMFTPADITVAELIVDDRPYAGLLFGSASLYAFDDNVADQLTLTAGVVGSASLAKQSQKIVHKVVDSPDPQGWSHQLHNEPVFSLSAERLWRLERYYDHGLEFDVIAGGGLGAGNLSSSAHAGMALRMGSRLSSTWAALSMIPSRTINIFASGKLPSWQLYLSLGGSYVFNDITLNGNTFRDSHSVELIHEQAVISTGVAVNKGQWGMSLSYQHGSDQFEHQPVKTRYGSLALIYRFDY